MKKTFLFLLLASLGVAISFISATKSSSYTEKISYHDGNYKSEKAWVSVVLSSDKTKMFVINVNEQREIRKSINFSILYSATKYDTLETCHIQKEVQIFLNDSNVVALFNTGAIQLPDSVVPRQTHIFGKDMLIKRSVKIHNNHVYLTSKNEIVDPARKDLIKKVLIISLVLLILNFIFMLNGMSSSSWFLLGIGIFLSMIIIFLRETNFPLFDAIFLSSSFIFTTIIFMIVMAIIKKKKNRNFNKQ